MFWITSHPYTKPWCSSCVALLKPVDAWDDENAIALHAKWWEARIARQKEIDEVIAKTAETEYLYDKPYEDPGRVRVAGPFTVESLSPHRVLPASEDDSLVEDLDAGLGVDSGVVQRANQCAVACGADAGGDFLAPQIGDRFDGRVRRDDDHVERTGRAVAGDGDELGAGTFVGLGL